MSTPAHADGLGPKKGGLGASSFTLGGSAVGPIVALGFALVVVIGCAIWVPQALTVANTIDVLRQIAVPGLIAAGVTFVVICGRLDLSVGSILSLTAIVAVNVENAAGPVAAISATLAVGALAGCLNGFLVAVLRLNSLITTLGTLSLLHGVALVYSAGQNIPVIQPQAGWFHVIGRGYLAGIPVPISILLGCALALGVILARSTFGRRIFAVGGNETASRFSSINATRTIFASYVISGLMTGAAAIVFASRVMTARNDSGTGYEIAVLSSIILGGTSLTGGAGGIGRTIIGVVVLGFAQNILVLLGLPYFTQWLVTWVVIILAVGADMARQRGRVFV